MANGLLQVAQAAENPQFLRRVKAALYQLAGDVRNESETVEHHMPRVFLAQQVAGGTEMLVNQFAWTCASNPAIRDSVEINEDGEVEVTAPDNDVLFVCSSAWNAMAGVVS